MVWGWTALYPVLIDAGFFDAYDETTTPTRCPPLPHTLHPTPYTLHPTPYTLHPTPYTLHLTSHTLHLTPYTVHPIPTPTRCTRVAATKWLP